MSYILDALKRAEHERSGALGTAPVRDSETGSLNRLSPVLLIAIGALLFGAGIGIAWLLLRPATPVLVAVAPATLAPVAPAPAPTAAPATAAPTPAEALADEAAVTPAGDPESGELLADAAEVEPALAGYQSLDDLTPVFQGVSAGAGTAIAKPKPAAASAAAASGGQAFQPPAPTAAPTHLEPSLRDMPESYRAQFPSPTIQVHVYNALPEKRWIMVDGKRLGEGSSLDSGPQIVEIAADGIVFNYRNERVFWPLQR